MESEIERILQNTFNSAQLGVIGREFLTDSESSEK